MKKKAWLVTGIIAAVLVALAVIIAVISDKEVVFETTMLEEGTVAVTVMATGYIQPVEEVEVGTQVSGVIEKIYVDFNSQVKRGDLLAELDKLTLQERLNQANASLLSAKSDLLNAQQNYDRIKSLYDVKAATQVSMEEATNRLNQTTTALANAKAELHQAEVNLGYAYIYSPINGVVLNRAVNVGQTVASAFSTPTLFTIAEDLTKMQVEANIDEADIGMVRMGQRVIFTVDAYNDMEFMGEVSQIRLQPIITSNVVTYTVIVDAPNPDLKLFPGMTANITIEIESETGVVVPIEATNFVMTPQLAEKAGISSEAMPRDPRSGYGIWVRKGEKIEHRTLETGLEDGVFVIARRGASAGEEVIVSGSIGPEKNARQATANPLIPKRPDGHRR